MKKSNFFKLFSILGIAIAGAVAVGAGTSEKKVEAVEAAAPSWTANLAGSFTGWSANLPMTWSEADQKYEYSRAFTAGEEFKVVVGSDWIGASSDLWTYNWKLTTGSNSSNFRVEMDGTFTVGIDKSKSVSIWFTSVNKTYIESGDATNAHVFKGSVAKDVWPGVSLLTEEDAYYNGNSKATVKYVATDASWDSTTIIFNNGGNGKQSNDLALENNAVYVWDGEHDWTFVKGTNQTNALPFVRYWRTLRSGGSICSHYNDSSKKTAVINAYDALGTGGKALVDNVSDYNDEYGNHTIGSTMAYFKGTTRFNAGNSLLLGSLGIKDSADMTLAIVLISLVAVSAVAGVYFIRKRKHN